MILACRGSMYPHEDGSDVDRVPNNPNVAMIRRCSCLVQFNTFALVTPLTQAPLLVSLMRTQG